VTQRLCPRCRSVLHTEDDTSLVFCWNCGAPQVQLSEELREQAALQAAAPPLDPNAPDADLAPPLPSGVLHPEPDAVLWPAAIRLAGLAGAIAAALSVLTLAFAPLILLSWFWAVSAPIIVLGLYSARLPATRITAAFGAQLGLLTGLAIALANSTLDTLGLFLARFVFHNPALIDTFYNQALAQMQLKAHASGDPDAAAALTQFLGFFNIPEFRVGMVLSMALVFFAMYLCFSAVGGAFAGFLRSRSGTPAR
jgi:hypothetical protein